MPLSYKRPPQKTTGLEIGDPGGNLEVRSTISTPLAVLAVEMAIVVFLGNGFNTNNIVYKLDPIFP